MEYSGDLAEPWGGRKNPHLNPWDLLKPRDFFDYEEYEEERSRLKAEYDSVVPMGHHHRRIGRELAKPSSEIVLLNPIDARFTYLDAEKDFDKKDYFQSGIRGTDFYKRELLSVNTWGETLLELVPEPSHKLDSNALAVDLKGARIGYIGGAIAAIYQGMVRSLRQSGKRVFTYGFVFKPHNGVIVLPTIAKMSELIEAESSLTIKEFWESLPTEFHQKVFDNNYHFNRETALELYSYRDTAPLFVPYDRNTPEEAIPMSWGPFLKDIRKARKKAELEKRNRRNKAIARLAATGMSYREIGRKYDLNSGTVGDIVRKLRNSNPEFAGSVPQTPVKHESNHHSPSKRIEAYDDISERNTAIMRMKSEGLTYREIGETVGLRPDSVKKIVLKARKASQI